MTDFSRARRHMVDSQVRTAGVTDRAVIEAMLSVPREAFLPEAQRALAYLDLQPEVSGRGPLSFATPSSGTISAASLSAAASALRWLASAISSWRVRAISHLRAVISMCSPMVRPVVGSLNVAGSAPLSHSTPPKKP